MADPIFEHPRLAAIYDALDPDRRDLDVYVAIAGELGARHVLDIGCGTGTFALLLADRGLEVTGIDPANGSLDVARAKPSSGRVRWICGTAKDLPSMQVDVVTMTGNVAQAIVAPSDWKGSLAYLLDRIPPISAANATQPIKVRYLRIFSSASRVIHIPGQEARPRSAPQPSTR